MIKDSVSHLNHKYISQIEVEVKIEVIRGSRGDECSVESVGCLGGHIGGCCGGSGDEVLELLDLSVLVL